MNAIAHASALPVSGPQLDRRRVLAAVIDLVVLAAGGLAIGLVAGLVSDGDTGSGWRLILLGWALYYYFACESGGGQTLGKLAMKLRVVRADGGKAGMREIFLRTILRVVDGFAFYLVGLVAMLVSGQQRQRLGDMAAGTIVADAEAPPAAAPAVASAAPVVAAPLVETESLETEQLETGPVEAEAEPVAYEPILGELQSEAGTGPEPDEPVVVRKLETVSAIDLVMDASEENEPALPAAPGA